MEFDGHKLRAKAYVLNCGRADHIRGLSTGYAWVDTAFKEFIESFKDLGGEIIQNMSQKQVQYEVENKSFYGYSTLMIIFYWNCSCSMGELVHELLQSLKSNDELRRVTKIVLDYTFRLGLVRSYEVKGNPGIMSLKKCNNRFITEDSSSTFNADYDEQHKSVLVNSFYFLPRVDNLIFISCKVTGQYHNEKQLSERGCEEWGKFEFVFEDHSVCGDCGRYIHKVEEQYVHYEESDYIDEIKFIHDPRYEALWKQEMQPKVEKPFFQSLLECLTGPHKIKSIQQFCEELQIDDRTKKISEVLFYKATSAGSSYFFSINPALFIAINHFTFQNFNVRKGAEKDIEAIKRMCTIQRIPHLIIEDGSAEQVQQLMHLIQTTDLSLLKHLFICIMSHGDYGDVIYTKTSAYTLADVKSALFKNKTLQNVKTLLFLNSCRGSFNPRYEDIPQPLESTETNDLNDNTAVLYSARKNCVSLRSESDGSCAVQKFTQVIEKCVKESSLKALHSEMENELLEENFDFDAMTELCCNHDQDHVVSMEFRNFAEFMEFFQQFEVAAKSLKQFENCDNKCEF